MSLIETLGPSGTELIIASGVLLFSLVTAVVALLADY